MTDQAAPATLEPLQTKFGRILPSPIVKEMEQAYLDYAMSVIVARALPDVRDGLKPVHRRILYSMYKSGIHHNSSYKKSARIVGDVLGRYHPHGDSAVYMALVRLAQDFTMRYQLIDGQGNFGSVDGDSPAAMRYTEARLGKITQELLADITKNTVPFVDNFDGSIQEPSVLPTKLPNLLLMGSEGIAVGMATKIPPHNLTEVGSAILATIQQVAPDSLTTQYTAPKLSKTDEITKDPLIQVLLDTPPQDLTGNFQSDITADQILEHIKGPDFPTYGTIYDFKAISEAYKTGKGRVVIRAKAEIIETPKGGFQIIVTELPYQVNKANLLVKIADLVRDKKIEGIRDLNDDSDRNGMQITIDLKRDARPKVVLNKLFKYTDLQTSFPMNMVALNSEGVPQLMTVKQVLREFIRHRQLVIVRRSQYELAEARDRAHILEGLLIALKNLDDVIETIRRSPDQDQARANLMSKFGLTEVQAQAILDMQLKRLAALERQKIEDEYQQITITIKKLLKLLQNPQEILTVVGSETQEMIDTYGDKRKTRVVKGKVGELSEEDLIARGETVITLTESGYIKRLDPNSFRSQSRGGKGSKGMTTKEEDTVTWLLTANTHDTILLFTNQGRALKLKAYEIPEGSRTAKGTAVVNLVNLQAQETVQSLLIVDMEQDKDKFITLCTRKGLIKKTVVSLFENIRSTGIIAISLKTGDELVWTKLTTEQDHIMVVTYQGRSIRFDSKEIKPSLRDTKGVKAITLLKDDYVVGMETFTAEASKDNKKYFRQILLVTEQGLGKRTPIDDYPVQKRSGMGVKVAKINTKTGPVAAAMMVTPDHDQLVISTQKGQAIKLAITKKSVPVLTRATQGVILMRLPKGDKVATATATLKEPSDNDSAS